MTVRATTAILLIALGGAGAVAVTTAPADPPVTGDPAVSYVTVTTHVDRRVDGLNARQWWARAVVRTKERNAARARVAEYNTRLITARRALRARFTTNLHGLVDAFGCIHRYEGPWDANTGNGYQNGLQMDSTFQRQYGGWALARFGAAYRWPPDVQIVVALTAYLSGRGFYPWPNTARMCGLL